MNTKKTKDGEYKSKPFTLRFPRARLEKLRQCAKEDGRTVSGLINKLVQDRINKVMP